MSAINDTWEYKVEEIDDKRAWCGECEHIIYDKPGMLRHLLQEWGAKGWEVISCICPNPSNYHTFHVVAKRRTGCTELLTASPEKA